MTEIELDVNKSVADNAADYYSRSKKAKAKLSGLEKAIYDSKKQIKEMKEKLVIEKENVEIKKKRKKKWFEGFRWFVSSDGFLVIGGKDAATNETVVKKHMEEKDLHFHADIHGAPHTVIKTGGKEVPERTIKEAAQFAASFSSAWKADLKSADVYYVNPDQVSKSAKPGEYLGRGAFMIYGKRNWLRNTEVSLAIGIIDYEGDKLLMCGPTSAVEKNCKHIIHIEQSPKEKKSDSAKKIYKILKGKLPTLELDDIMRVLPTGGIKIVA